jgi:hypothetical protein
MKKLLSIAVLSILSVQAQAVTVSPENPTGISIYDRAARQVRKIEPIPSKILGSWCGSWAYNFPDAAENVGYLWWAKDVEECANRGGIRFGKSGYEYHRFGPQGSCRYTNVQFAADKVGLREEDIQPKGPDGKLIQDMVRPGAPSGVYLIEANCVDGNSHWNESFYTQSVRGWLIREEQQGVQK